MIKFEIIDLIRIMKFSYREDVFGNFVDCSIFEKQITDDECNEIINGEHYFCLKTKSWVSPLTKNFKQELERILK